MNGTTTVTGEEVNNYVFIFATQPGFLPLGRKIVFS